MITETNILEKRLIELSELYRKTKNEEYMIQEYCLSHFFEISKENYIKVLEYCIANNIKGIVDIGCAKGFQSELFLNNNIDYIGVEESSNYFWNDDKFKYIKAKYPISLKEHKNYLAVSILCISWNCYLYNGMKDLHLQFKQLTEFDKCLIYGQKEHMEIAKYYFKEVNNICGSFYELKR
ncbi:hypothetical protein C672_3613 [[Clostridium] bifermentans ATCC 638]|uniref:Methyltransferase domain protein n=1 Tax=Paraclostridium bifermentans ATCC 638 = DSM 14991 TaxID=1233171 RepID=T4V7U1_PARBF|nr:hypothetical protein [Paraclostridium bifermentans]EQK39794.1 hypothetical protein C672_3613 [[Clostridium] bifermentans ATCC 638] [Paraclostridium bifermentans ATCC 638 = DSM 14991]RIZ57437.1 hypothetical protein CHH45_16500 [Paraclostridium bifermentans]